MNHYLIYTTLTTWKEPPRSRHQITSCLQAKGNVYFVERSRIGFPRVEVSSPEGNVIVITPYFPIDYRIRYRTPGLNELYHYWILSKIKDLKIDFELVFTFDHTSHIIHLFYKEVIYYCGDDFIGNAIYTLPIINYFHRLIEQKLITQSKMCVVTSEYLLTKHLQYNERTHLVPLGSPTINTDMVYKRSANKTPTLGIVAFFDFRIPLDVLDQLLKEFKIYLIGPTDQCIRERFQDNENAIFTGTKSGKELYQLIADEVDVCIAPYAEDKINKGLTPNKLWLYLALGKPCVVTEIPNIKGWGFGAKVVYKCSNQDFGRTCKIAYEENNEALFIKRIKIAEENSWNNRLERIISYYQKNEEVVKEGLLLC